MPSEAVNLSIPELTRHLQIFIHGEQDRFVSQRLRQEGIWEPFETSLVMSLLPVGGTFVDVGANIGYFCLVAASVVGDGGRVFACEPDPDNFRLLLNSAEHNGLAAIIHAEQVALAAENGEGRLYLSDHNLGDHQVYAGEGQRPSLPIALRNGSELLSGLAGAIDLVKVDTQGAEYAVMQGLMPLLRDQASPANILIELTPLSLRQAGASGRSLIELLAGLGQPFWIVDHIEHRLVASNAEELACWCDDVDAVPGDEGFMNILVGPGTPAVP